MFLKIINIFQKSFSIKKKTIFLIIAILGFFLLTSENTFASTEKEDFDKAIGFIDWLLKVVSMLLAIITYLTTIFLDPAWISWSLFWLDTYFKQIWILVSNVVYFVFAFIIIWIAFMNIIWKGQEKYALKSALPRFVIWILIVPFTWYIIQFVLSISSILTAAALTLPAETFTQFETKLNDIKIPKDCRIVLWSKPSWDKSWTPKTDPKKSTEWFFDCEKDKWKWVTLKTITSWEWWNSSTFWLIATYTYWILSIDTLDDFTKLTVKSWVTKITDLIVKLGIDLLFILVYSILMITLGIALATRWIYLWIYTIISPVFWLVYFFDKKEWSWEWFMKNFSVWEFIALAMVPVYTMLALSFWLLFIFVIWTWMSKWVAEVNTWGHSFVRLDDKWVTIWDGDQAFTLKIEWAILWSTDSKNSFTSVFSKVGTKWLWVVWTIIIQFFSIMVLWMAVMAALKSSAITAAVTEPIRQFWAQVWGLLQKMPTYAPIFPGGQSMSSMGQASRNLEQHYFTNKTSERAREFSDKFTGTMPVRESALKLNQHLATLWENEINEKTITTTNNLLSKVWDVNELIKESEAVKGLINIAKRLNKKSWYEMNIDDLDKKTELTRDEAAKIIGVLDKFWKNNELWKLLGEKTWGPNTKDSDLSRYLRKQKDDKTQSSNSANTANQTQNTASWTKNITDAANIKNAIWNITVNTDNKIMIWSKEYTFGWYDEKSKTIRDVWEFAESLKDKWLWAENELDFKELMTNLGITDFMKIKELEKALGITA